MLELRLENIHGGFLPSHLPPTPEPDRPAEGPPRDARIGDYFEAQGRSSDQKAKGGIQGSSNLCLPRRADHLASLRLRSWARKRKNPASQREIIYIPSPAEWK